MHFFITSAWLSVTKIIMEEFDDQSGLICAVHQEMHYFSILKFFANLDTVAEKIG
jgi:hypothetical protein